ncbi:permease [Propionigenium maris DSM 9537]|uniref:Permease n=1 Tax=Propionigenium maris DSM 9537 TaxID=1123000 RepID=A0A9W6GI09_9FUSO|nr:LptF/LptG family permease [Propionigenium maris]GLI55568.1 permease [Propionigenium maris DSM 9537]
MKRIDKYITINFIKSLGLSLFGFINIFIVSQLFKIIRYVTEGRMNEIEAVHYIIALLPDILIKITPLAVLLGGLMTINKMASNLEIIALKTSGISFKRIVVFPVIISFMVSLTIFYMYDKVYPRSIVKSRAIRRGKYEENTLPEKKANAFLRGVGDYVYHAGEINRVEGTATHLQIIDLDSKFERIERIINAESAQYNREKSLWELKNVTINTVQKERVETLASYEDKEYHEEPELFLTPKIEVKEMTVKELKDVLTIIKRTGGSSREILAEIANRRAFPFASFVVCFLGLALGSRYVRGANALSIAMSVALGYGYYILQASLEAISLSGLIHPFVAFWLPNVIFLGIGIYAMHRAEF